MTELEIHAWLVRLVFGLALASFLLLLFVVAPYGRHRRSGWGPTLGFRAGWIWMESPAVFAFAAIYSMGEYATRTVPMLLLALWMLHYIDRALLYPFQVRSRTGRMPVAVVLSGFSFNCINAYINARWISSLGPYSDRVLLDPWLLAGVAIFFGGRWLNRRSDRTLLALRAPGEEGYKIPHGGAYRWVTCPNYLGEIIEWFGWAIAAWSLPGLAFAVFTVANLLPRALSHHRWYREQFPDYPPERKAILPYLL